MGNLLLVIIALIAFVVGLYAIHPALGIGLVILLAVGLDNNLS